LKLIELIQVRSFSENDKQHAIGMFNDMELKGSKIPNRIKLLGNQLLPTDLMIYLYWDKAESSSFKSAIGEKLAQRFKSFGWISHLVWTPLQEKN